MILKAEYVEIEGDVIAKQSVSIEGIGIESYSLLKQMLEIVNGTPDKKSETSRAEVSAKFQQMRNNAFAE